MYIVYGSYYTLYTVYIITIHTTIYNYNYTIGILYT